MSDRLLKVGRPDVWMVSHLLKRGRTARCNQSLIGHLQKITQFSDFWIITSFFESMAAVNETNKCTKEITIYHLFVVDCCAAGNSYKI